jgi:hypothetical protein
VDTDGPLKLLFRKYAADLLPLTGDSGATVERAGPVEIQALKRQVDCVLALERDGERYYRHLEFQAQSDPEMAVRCFRYNTQLVLQYGAPVLTTVLYLFPPGSRSEPVFRVMLGGREINRWVFEEVHLFEMDAKALLARGDPGLLALVPLMRGADLGVLEESARRIERAHPGEKLSDAEDVLLALAARFYTVPELARVVGRDRMWQHETSLYVEGKQDGKLEGAREACAAVARKHHPRVFERVASVIAACDEPSRLNEWILAASDLSDDEFVALVSIVRR